MKSKEKVISDRTFKIESNNLKVIGYNNKVLCKCKLCNYEIEDNYRNLIGKNFKCKYCALLSSSDLLKNNEVKLLKIKGTYSYLECKNNHTYKQDKRNLLANKKCKQCYLDSKVFSKEKVINDIENIHGDYYKYNFDGFKNIHSKIEIKCKEGHIFHQKVSNHLQGKGCPICRESIGERKISKYLQEKNIKFTRQKKFNDCFFKEKLSFDFYIENLNILIEFDGIQHFKPVKIFGGEKEFQKNKIRDKIKNEYCIKNNIHLIRISYLDIIEEKLLHINEFIIF